MATATGTRDVGKLAVAQAALWHRGRGPAEARRMVKAAAARWPADALTAALATLDELDDDRTPSLPCVSESPARDALRRILGDGGEA